MGSWLLCVGWFGFNVMSAQTLAGHLRPRCHQLADGDVRRHHLRRCWRGRNDPGFVHNGALAGLVAVCAGSDIMHPIGAFVTGGVAGIIFVQMFQKSTNGWKIDDVLGVWALHGLCGLWGGIACGIFGLQAFGGIGGVTFGRN